jgi:DNA-directed RNA polymerase subunit beta
MKNRASFFTQSFEYDLTQNLHAVSLHEAIGRVLATTFPVVGKHGSVHYVDHQVVDTTIPAEFYIAKKETMYCKVQVTLQLVTANTVQTDTITLGLIPQMTPEGTYIINGITKVVLNTMTKGDGVVFDAQNNTVTVVPESGAWLDFGLTVRHNVYAQVDKGNKFPVNLLWEVMGGEVDFTVGEIPLKLTEEAALAHRTVNADTYSQDEEWNQVRVENYVTSRQVEYRKRVYPAGTPVAKFLGRIPVVFAVRLNPVLNTVIKYKSASRMDALKRLWRFVFPKADFGFDSATTWLNVVLGYKLELGDFLKSRLNGLGINCDIAGIALGMASIIDHLPEVTDVDAHFQKRVYCPNSQIAFELRRCLSRVWGEIQYKLDLETVQHKLVKDVVNLSQVERSIYGWFATSATVQFVDQDNILSEVAHKRRTTTGGGAAEDARSRDVHVTQYGRLCPIETPEGANIGTVGSISAVSRLSEDGFVRTPYYEVHEGVVSQQVVWLTANNELGKYIAPYISQKDGVIDEVVLGRLNHEPIQFEGRLVNLLEVSPSQILSAGANLVPFIHHDEANRALMGANMQRQAVPLLNPEVPIVGTGFERLIAEASGKSIECKREGTVIRTGESIVVKTRHGVDEYPLVKWTRSNQSTLLHHTCKVTVGDRVKRGHVLADYSSTCDGELALGRNLVVAFMPWQGYNYEDAIILNEKLVADGKLDSVYMAEFEVEIKTTQFGNEEATSDIPDAPLDKLAKLDANGLVYVGAKVRAGDYLVGKVTPKPKGDEVEDNLMRAIFGDKAASIKNSSYKVPSGTEGTVVKVEVIAGEESRLQARYLQDLEESKVRVNKDFEHKIQYLEELIGKAPKEEVKKLKEQLDYQEKLQQRVLRFMSRPPQLSKGTLATVKITLAQTRRIRVGDKLAGRHGNKGVVSKVAPQEDMPYLADGTPVDIILNPLGVPSRMNVGQVLEVHLGAAARQLTTLLHRIKDEAKLAKALQAVYKNTEGSYEGKEVRFAVPAFTDCQGQVDRLLQLAGIESKVDLYDGMTGDKFENKVTVGVMYMVKLHHMVDDKMHARSVGPYSQITQQPLGGRANFGGQRLGEMEVWALEAYGAKHVLHEMMTYKSDDVEGRTKAWDSIVAGKRPKTTTSGAAFGLLCRELNGLCLDLSLLKKEV